MKKNITVLFFLVLAVCGAAITSSCGSTPKTKELTDFERATLAIANQVADLFEYDHEYYERLSIAIHVWNAEKDPVVKKEYFKKLAELTRERHELNNFEHALATGITVCGGYAKLFYKLAKEAGYDVYYIGTFAHAYNAILFEGTWYFFDITWYDTPNRNVKWLWSPMMWDDLDHIHTVEIYKLGNTYEIDRDATRIAAEGIEFFTLSEGDFKVLIKDGRTVTINRYTGKAAAVVIPATIGGRPVVAIGDYAFNRCTGLTSVNIPEGVTSIGKDAFTGCTDLTSVNIPASVTDIGGFAFAYCTGLTSVNIPTGVTSIGQWAFGDCTGLTSVSISASVTSIKNYAFYGCNLTTIRIGANVRFSNKTTFENNFGGYYDANGKKAGVYTFRNGAWSYSER